MNKLKADVKSLEEGAKRLSGGTKSQEVPGRNLRSVAGDGDRQYLSGLKVGGKRIFLLVDASASMLAEDIVNAVRRQLFPPETRLRARKWRQAVKAVDWLAAQMPREAQYQIYVFNTRALPVLPGTQGVWLEAKDAATLDKAIAALRQTAPEGGTSLHHAFAAAAGDEPAARQHHPDHGRPADPGRGRARAQDRVGPRPPAPLRRRARRSCRGPCRSTSCCSRWRATRWR